MGRRRAVITGMGVVGVAGSGTDALWRHLLDPDAGPGDGTAVGFDPADVLPRREARRLDRFAVLAIAAARQAVADAGDHGAVPDRCGTVIGTAYGGVRSLHEGTMVEATEGPGAVSPLLGTMFPVSAAPSEVAARLGWSGPSHSLSAACATGSLVVGEAARLVADGRCDVVVAGGSESPVTPAVLAAFRKLKVLTAGRPRPFDVARDGFAFAEGACAVVVEDRERALARGAAIHAEVAGSASRTDVAGQFSPSGESDTLLSCMRAALADAGVAPADVAHVNAHGTGTRSNDAAEALAVRTLLGPGVPVTSVKGAVGHAGGAAGTVEAVAAALSMRHRLLTPIAGLVDPDPAFDVDLVRRPRPWVPGPVLSNSLGLGGHVACLVLTPP